MTNTPGKLKINVSQILADIIKIHMLVSFRCVNTLKYRDLRILDHLVNGFDKYYSMADEGIMPS